MNRKILAAVGAAALSASLAFAGAFDLAFKTVAIGTTITTNQTNGILDVNNGYTATVPAGKTWRIGGGVFLDGLSAKINVKGTLITPKIAALGVNAHLVLEDGGVIEVESFPEEKRLCADLYGGTLRINANATAKEGVRFGGTDITGAFVTPEKGVSVALALEPEGVVDGVKVKPELAMDGGASFRLEGDGAVFDVKVIAGLWYSVKYGTELSRGNVGGAAGTTGAVQAAETGVKTITAPRCGERGFYKLIVAPADD